MKKHIYTISLQILAIIFLVFGLIGLFLPILQGILFIVIGLVILSFTSSTFEQWFDKILRKNETIYKHYSHHRDKLRKIHRNHKN